MSEVHPVPQDHKVLQVQLVHLDLQDYQEVMAKWEQLELLGQVWVLLGQQVLLVL